MKPEPLKGKTLELLKEGEEATPVILGYAKKVYKEEDVKAAVLWFKQQTTKRGLMNERCEEYDEDCVNCCFWKLFDDAFPDVLEVKK